MRRILGILIAVLLLGYGLIGIGVGAFLLAQSLEVVNFPELAEGVADVKVFIGARASDQLLPFSLNGYFGYILVMGLMLSAGAAGVIARARWGYIILSLYLLMHAALFVNFQEINPKLIVLILQVAMVLLLYYLMPPAPDKPHSD